MLPEPFRGQTAHPGHVHRVAERIARSTRGSIAGGLGRIGQRVSPSTSARPTRTALADARDSVQRYPIAARPRGIRPVGDPRGPGRGPTRAEAAVLLGAASKPRPLADAA